MRTLQSWVSPDRRFAARLIVLMAVGTHSLAAQELQFAEMGDCQLESGDVIHECRIGYRTLGRLNAEGTNAILFPTWFGGTSEEILEFLGPDGMIDPAKDYVVVVDAFANGVSSSPSNSERQRGSAFPRVTIRDMVRQQHRLLEEKLQITRLKAVAGISMGGMQAFEWAVSYPGFAKAIVPVVGSPRLAPYDIVLWETQLKVLDWFLECECQTPAAVRMGISFLSGGPDLAARVSPRDSLQAVRAGINGASLDENTARNLMAQLHAMIDHDVSTLTGGSMESAAHRVDADFLVVVGLEDHVVTPGPALEFARILGAPTLQLESDCGHGAPWCQADLFNRSVREFLARF